MRRSLVLVIALAGCAAPQRPAPRPDDMSAEEHRREADKEREAAERHLADYDPRAVHDVRPIGPIDDPSDTYVYGVTVYNPTEAHLDKATEHHMHAEEHEAAARELERFEEAECAQFPPATRISCPLLTNVVAIEDRPGGARVSFSAEAPVEAIAAHMRCHLAWARVRGYPPEASCPLYRKGLRVQPDGRAIDVTIDDRDMVPMIRKQLRREAIPAGAPTT